MSEVHKRRVCFITTGFSVYFIVFYIWAAEKKCSFDFATLINFLYCSAAAAAAAIFIIKISTLLYGCYLLGELIEFTFRRFVIATNK